MFFMKKSLKIEKTIKTGSIVKMQAAICVVIWLAALVVDDVKLNNAYPTVGMLGNHTRVF